MILDVLPWGGQFKNFGGHFDRTAGKLGIPHCYCGNDVFHHDGLRAYRTG